MDVAVLGLGAMGSRIARNLLDAHHRVTVYNRTPERTAPLAALGAIVASSPAEAARRATIIISMVRDDEASRAIWMASDDGALHAAGDETIVIESSTVRPAWVRELAAHAERRNVRFLDAPIVGSRPAADAKQLVYLVGGDESTLNAARDVLAVSARAIHHTGAIGSGAALKLVVNALYAIQVATAAELLGAIEAQRLDAVPMLEILSTLPVASQAFQNALGLMLRDDTRPQFPISLVEKDLEYALSLTDPTARELPMTTQARRVFHEAMRAGLGEQNITGINRLSAPASAVVR